MVTGRWIPNHICIDMVTNHIWLPSHIDVDGIEQVDAIAKLAAQLNPEYI